MCSESIRTFPAKPVTLCVKTLLCELAAILWLTVLHTVLRQLHADVASRNLSDAVNCLNRPVVQALFLACSTF